jgi:hydroxymethylpyrimidine/phosphomethylpyrimidine kinase
MNERPYVLSFEGFDPNRSAGVTSDIKTYEQHKVCGLSVITAISFENASFIKGLEYAPKANKITLIESELILKQIQDWIKKYWSETFIICKSILKASTGFPFQSYLHRTFPKHKSNYYRLKWHITSTNTKVHSYIKNIIGISSYYWAYTFILLNK